jgi:GT2 family glycosyltransferase
LKDLSIITINRRNWENLSRFLRSLASITEAYFTYEVIVVDNSYDPEKINQYRLLYPEFKFIPNTQNSGAANGKNIGAANANGKYLLFLDVENLISERSVLAMLDQAKVSRANSVVSCRQINVNGAEIKSYGYFPSLLTLTGWLETTARFFRIIDKPAENKRLIFPDWISGSAMMMSTTSFNRIGKWNERFWIYFEDVDFCSRASQLGGAVLMLKNVSLQRNQMVSTRSDIEYMATLKTEQKISNHEYISLHEDGVKEVLMHLLLVLSNLIIGLVGALLGLVFYSSRSLQVLSRGYLKLLNYYLKALLLDTWISPRVVKHPQSHLVINSLDENVAIMQNKNLQI